MEKSWFKNRVILIYSIVSLILFEKVYETSKEVIDELFHIEQGLNYCNGMYQEFNPKITTLPGLYLLTAFLPRCNPFFLRLIPLTCSVINFYLIYGIKSKISADRNDQGKLGVLIDSMALISLPPMYFFAHLYYTDIPSITTILLTIYFSLKEKFFISSLFGILSVLMRQTNIVWIGGVLGAHMIDLMILNSHEKTSLEETTLSHFLYALKLHLKTPKLLMKFLILTTKKFYGYFLCILSFIAFLYINGSIVVGDKAAHQATIHVTQIFYFSLFTLVFGSSFWIPKVLNTVKTIFSWKIMLKLIALSLVMTLIIYYNTIVHPYLLADNRHYTFYIWKRVYENYWFTRYLLIPLYIFGIFSIFKSLDGSFGFKFFFVISTIFSLCFQSLLEVRYFLIPFVILKLQTKNINKKLSFLEFINNLAINFLTFSIFFNKEVKWSDFDEPQRIIW